jgi:hypothetical protein
MDPIKVPDLTKVQNRRRAKERTSMQREGRKWEGKSKLKDLVMYALRLSVV